MLPLRQFPDHVYDSLKKGVVGRKKVYNCEVLAERALNVPLTERDTYRNLTVKLNVSKNTVAKLLKEGVFSVHYSHVKPVLSETHMELQMKFCMERIDVRSLSEDPDVAWQYVDMYDEVYVDEKWFDEIFESRKMPLVKGENPPCRKTIHTSHIPKILFLCAQARPRYHPNRKHAWDRKIAPIPIGHYVKD
jgi:hypothetical protein